MEGRRGAKQYFIEFRMGTTTRHLTMLAGRCLRLIDILLRKGAVTVEVDENECFTLYIELPKDKDKWLPIMIEITNAHPQKVSEKVFYLIEGKVTVIKVAMVDGIKEVKA